MSESVWLEKTGLEAMASSALEELGGPFSRLGRRWIESPILYLSSPRNGTSLAVKGKPFTVDDATAYTEQAGELKAA